MRALEFFREIAHVEVPWGERHIWVPVFYYDVMTFSAYWLAPIKRVEAILPSKRMHPWRVTPWHCLVSITAYAYRDSDIGPYNELSISVPVTVDKVSPLFTGILRNMKVPKVYIHCLPVTTEIARDAGVEFAGYPKFLADIDFEEQDGWVRCHLRADDKPVLTLAGRKLDLTPIPRLRAHPFTFHQGRLLRSEFILSERAAGGSRNTSDVQLELGDHPIAQELRDLRLGRMVSYQFCPQFQAILTPVVESLPG